jgi:hypothetical protein
MPPRRRSQSVAPANRQGQDGMPPPAPLIIPVGPPDGGLPAALPGGGLPAPIPGGLPAALPGGGPPGGPPAALPPAGVGAAAAQAVRPPAPLPPGGPPAALPPAGVGAAAAQAVRPPAPLPPGGPPAPPHGGPPGGGPPAPPPGGIPPPPPQVIPPYIAPINIASPYYAPQPLYHAPQQLAGENFSKSWGRAKIIKMGVENFDEWERSVRNVFYTEGWDCILTAADAKVRAVGVSAHMRKAAWGCVTTSLSIEMGELTDHVPMGSVEVLIAEIFKLHYRDSVASRDGLKGRLYKICLEEYKTFEAYVAGLRSVVRRLKSLKYDVPEEDMIFHLLKGLPSDYATCVQVVRCAAARSPMPFVAVVSDVREFCQNNPRVFGSGAALSKRSDTVLNVNDTSNASSKSKAVCRYFSQGKTCPFSPCKFLHEKLGSSSSSSTPTCTYCKRGRHEVTSCYKKRKDDKSRRKKRDDNNNIEEDFSESDPDSDEVFTTTDHVSEECFLVEGGKDEWIIDGGSTCHVSVSAEGLRNVSPANIRIVVGGGKSLKCTQIGDLRVSCLVGGVKMAFTLKNVRHCPLFGRNIMSEAPFIVNSCAVLKVSGVLTITTKKGKGTTIVHSPWNKKMLFSVRLSRKGSTDLSCDVVVKPIATPNVSHKNSTTGRDSLEAVEQFSTNVFPNSCNSTEDKHDGMPY